MVNSMVNMTFVNKTFDDFFITHQRCWTALVLEFLQIFIQLSFQGCFHSNNSSKDFPKNTHTGGADSYSRKRAAIQQDQTECKTGRLAKKNLSQ